MIKNNSRFWRYMALIVAILRIFTPALIFVYPTLAAILNIIVLDGVDGLAFSNAGLSHKSYITYDKLIDFWWYGFIVLFFWTKPLFTIFFLLFLFRSFGHWISIITRKEIWLFYFPAIIEIYFIGFLIALNFPQLKFFYQGGFIYYSLAFATIIALVREYVIHITRKSVGKVLLGVGPKWSK